MLRTAPFLGSSRLTSEHREYRPEFPWQPFYQPRAGGLHSSAGTNCREDRQKCSVQRWNCLRFKCPGSITHETPGIDAGLPTSVGRPCCHGQRRHSLGSQVEVQQVTAADRRARANLAQGRGMPASCTGRGKTWPSPRFPGWRQIPDRPFRCRTEAVKGATGAEGVARGSGRLGAEMGADSGMKPTITMGLFTAV
jgi:hypothetical protein